MPPTLSSRRTALTGIALAAFATAAPLSGLRAQRPAHPIQRPPGWSGRPLQPGRLPPWTTGGVADAAAVPGTFTVTSINRMQNMLRLRDDDGRGADVFVRPDLYDLSTLKPGDEVAVDFLVPDGGDKRLAAGAIFRIEPDRP